MNKLMLIGNLTRDPELRMTADGTPVCNFTLAVNSRRQGEEAQFFRVTVWRKLGETCAQYLSKGRKVFVAGPVKVRTYTGSDGTERYSLDVTADDVEFVSSKAEDAAGQTTAQEAPQTAPTQAGGYSPAGYGAAAYSPAQAGYTRAEDDDECPF